MNRNDELDIHLKRQEKKIATLMANEAFLQFARPHDLHSVEVLRAHDIVKNL